MNFGVGQVVNLRRIGNPPGRWNDKGQTLPIRLMPSSSV